MTNVKELTEWLKGQEVCGFTIAHAEEGKTEDDRIGIDTVLEHPTGRRFLVVTQVKRKATENEEFDLFGFVVKKLINAARIIDKRFINQ